MTQTLIELTKLAQLSKLVQDKELARLAEVSARRDNVRSEISDLKMELAEFLNGDWTEDASCFSQHGAYWQEWQRQKHLALHITLAKLEAEREAVWVVAQKAFGRMQAVEKVILRHPRKPGH